MVIVVCLGVTFSTFLSTPVAILGTMFAVLLGFFGSFVQDLWTGKALRRRPRRSLDPAGESGQPGQAAGVRDGRTSACRSSSSSTTSSSRSSVRCPRVLPDFSGLGRASEYVAYNFNFYDQLLARQCLTTFVYVTAIAIVGYFFMRTREVAA